MESGTPGPWTPAPAQPPSAWPPADSASADFALANNPTVYDIRLYYVVNGSLAEVAMTGRAQWEAARPVPANNGSLAAVVVVPPGTNATGTTTAGDGSGGLSTGQKAGIGVGVGVAGVALLAALAFALLVSRRRRRGRGREGRQADGGGNVRAEKAEAEVGTDGQVTGEEMPADFAYMQAHTQAPLPPPPPSELQGDGRFPSHELDNSAARKREALEREPCPYSEAWHAANPQHLAGHEDR